MDQTSFKFLISVFFSQKNTQLNLVLTSAFLMKYSISFEIFKYF